MSSETVYTVTWKEGGKSMAEPYSDFMQAEARARALSMQRAGAVLIESRPRYIHARWEKGAQTLARSVTLIAGMEL